MCGIVGIWNFDGKPVNPAGIDRFTNSLAHRGPDGRGVWKDDSVGIALGHRRLAILDLSEGGKQPMSYADGRYWITFNGEIYNFLELRDELKEKGHVFRSQSDTEVILAAYQEWGSDMLIRFNGMWAFAIFNRKNKTLFIARDRFGIKPFHYRLTTEQFAFASELKAFKCLDGCTPQIDYESAEIFLRNGFGIEGSKRTMLKNVYRLQGGHCGIIKDGRLTIKRWWNTLDHLVEPPASFMRQAEEFRELFYDAVKLRMRSDVSIGSCLSGGFDSSAIVCALAETGKQHKELRQAGDWQQTFVATFPGAFNDERQEAEEVVHYADVKAHFFPVTDKESVMDLEQILLDFDDVYIGMPSAAWLIYRELRRAKVVVSLDGHGADELMGAYCQPDYLLFQDAPSLWKAPAKNHTLIDEYKRVLKRFEKFNTASFSSPAAALLNYHPSLRYYRSIRGLLRRGSDLISSVLGRAPSFVAAGHSVNNEDFQVVGQTDRLPEHWGQINRSFYPMFHSYTLPTILRNFDRMSMAHGVEIRMPFMDWRLVCYVFSLSDEAKISGAENKKVLREAMKGRMPEGIRAAKHKIGFNSPMPEWFNGPLSGWIKDLAGSRECRESELINGAQFSKYVNRHCLEKSWTWQNSGAAWSILHYLWFEKRFLSDS